MEECFHELDGEICALHQLSAKTGIDYGTLFDEFQKLHWEFYKEGTLIAVSPRLLVEWCQRRQRSVYYLDGTTLVLKSVGESHLPAICFACFDAHCYMYSSAAWVQNLPVREIRPLPERVLPCAKHDRTPEWTEFRDFPYSLEPGWFHAEDLEEVRAWLYKKRLRCQAKLQSQSRAA